MDAPVATTAHPLAPPPPAAPARRGGLRTVAQFIAGAAIGGVVAGIGMARLDDAFGEVDLWVVLPALFASMWLHVVLHEGGHALAGMAGGMRPLAFGIGPLRWERGVGGWRLRRGGGVRGIGGFALLVPRGDAPMRRGAAIAFVLGGPLANLLAAAPALAGAASASSGTWAAALGTFGVVGLLLGGVNLVPFVTHGWHSDGRTLLDLAAGRPDALRTLALSQLAGLSVLGVRPRDWPPALVPPAPTAPLPPQDMTARQAAMIAWIHALDADRPESARAAAAHVLPTVPTLPDGHRQLIAQLYAEHAVRVERDAGLADAWLALTGGGLVDQGAQLATIRAGIAALRGDAAGVATAVAEARAALGRVHDAASATVLAERLDALERGTPPSPPVGADVKLA